MASLSNVLLGAAGLTLLAALKNSNTIAGLFRSSAASSWADVSKALRVEPVTIVDERCLHLPYLTDILYTATATSAAYYLQAVAVQGTVGKLDVVRTLDGLNPNRDTVSNVGFMIGDVAAVAMQDTSSKLVMYDRAKLQEHFNNISREDFDLLNANRRTHSMEATPLELAAKAKGSVLSKIEEDVAANMTDTGSVSTTDLKSVTDIANLSVGALISVELADGNEKKKLPVSIRLIVSGIKVPILKSIFTSASKNESIKERYHMWRAGQISFIRDLILCQDILDQDIKNRIEDKSGAWREMKERQSRNRLNTILSLGMRPSVGQAANIYVISKETLMECESAMGGKISNPTVRSKIFGNTMMFLLYVVDTRKEVVECWHRNQGTSTIHSIKEMRLNSKEKSASIELNDAFRAYTGTGF